YLNANSLSGPLPTQLGHLTMLTTWQQYSNSLTGSLPTEIGLMTALKNVVLNSNIFSGSLPTEIGLLSSIEYLALSYNNITGQVPTELGFLTKLTYLDLRYNSLTGPVPTVLLLLPNLTWTTGTPCNENNLENVVTCPRVCLTQGSCPGFSDWYNETALTQLQIPINKCGGYSTPICDPPPPPIPSPRPPVRTYLHVHRRYHLHPACASAPYPFPAPPLPPYPPYPPPVPQFRPSPPPSPLSRLLLLRNRSSTTTSPTTSLSTPSKSTPTLLLRRFPTIPPRPLFPFFGSEAHLLLLPTVSLHPPPRPPSPPPPPPPPDILEMVIIFSGLDAMELLCETCNTTRQTFEQEFIQSLKGAGVWEEGNGVPEVVAITAGSTVVDAVVVYPPDTVIESAIYRQLYESPGTIFTPDTMPSVAGMLGDVFSQDVMYTGSVIKSPPPPSPRPPPPSPPPSPFNPPGYVIPPPPCPPPPPPPPPPLPPPPPPTLTDDSNIGVEAIYWLFVVIGAGAGVGVLGLIIHGGILYHRHQTGTEIEGFVEEIADDMHQVIQGSEKGRDDVPKEAWGVLVSDS
ncbi:hypothetical protein CYMTET_25424, partial [Cymbomonas tetramitiformis]